MDRIRFDEVDVIRAFGIIAIIIIHILTYNLSNPLNKFLWNNLQFVVVSFVFCSGFVLASIYTSFASISQTLSWYKKRFIRLILPFWIYLCFHYTLWILFPNSFSGLGLSKDAGYFIKSAALIGGDNLNWLPLIFLMLTFLFPIFMNWKGKKKIMTVYLILSVIVTIIFTFITFPYSYYRFVMWIPWSLVLLFSIYISVKAKEDKNAIKTSQRYLLFGILFFVMYLCFHILNTNTGKLLNFYNHKYPPDFYYLLFGISLTCFSLLIARLKIWKNKMIKNTYGFISKNSYQIFFIHYILLDAVLILSKHKSVFKSPIIQFTIILFVSLIIAAALDKVTLIFKKK